MIRRTVFILSVLCLLTVGTVSAAEAPQTALNTLRDLSSSVQGSDVVIGVEGTYPILDYTYYDYDPETFVVDLADSAGESSWGINVNHLIGGHCLH